MFLVVLPFVDYVTQQHEPLTAAIICGFGTIRSCSTELIYGVNRTVTTVAPSEVFETVRVDINDVVVELRRLASPGTRLMNLFGAPQPGRSDGQIRES